MKKFFVRGYECYHILDEVIRGQFIFLLLLWEHDLFSRATDLIKTEIVICEYFRFLEMCCHFNKGCFRQVTV